ncbi:hypothetical protein D3C73_1287660 [compost metagenome]
MPFLSANDSGAALGAKPIFNGCCSTRFSAWLSASCADADHCGGGSQRCARVSRCASLTAASARSSASDNGCLLLGTPKCNCSGGRSLGRSNTTPFNLAAAISSVAT